MSEVYTPLLRVQDLRRYFPIRGGFWNRVVKTVQAVDGPSFEIREGRTLGLIGESGCGKTTVGKLVLRLLEPDSGSISFKGEQTLDYSAQELRVFRAQAQMVYQDPFSSLDPRMNIRDIVAEPLKIHSANVLGDNEIEVQVDEMIQRVGLHRSDLSKYPHMFSGGQSQRIGIARALILRPSLVILDEPTSALDVSIQAKLLRLLLRLQSEMKLTYLFISHDMRVIRLMSDDVAVMYLGRILESGPIEQVFSQPRHPYTQALLAAMPSPDPRLRLDQLVQLEGEIGDPTQIPDGCPFWPRCPQKIGPICEEHVPQLLQVAEQVAVSCHLYHEPAYGSTEEANNTVTTEVST